MVEVFLEEVGLLRLPLGGLSDLTDQNLDLVRGDYEYLFLDGVVLCSDVRDFESGVARRIGLEISVSVYCKYGGE